MLDREERSALHSGNRDIQPVGESALIQWVEPTGEVGLFAFGAADLVYIDCMNPCTALSVRDKLLPKKLRLSSFDCFPETIPLS